MAVLIGHASKSENNSVTGTPGDQTKSEVCTRSFYNGGWEFVAIHPDATVRENIAVFVEQSCANNNIGYSQVIVDKMGRNSLNEYAAKVAYDASKVATAVNCDCSSLINTAVVAAGKGSYGSNGWTTSTMKSQLSALGFKIVTSNLTTEAYAVRGAIYCKANSHVICALENGSKASTTLTNAGATVSTGASSSVTSSAYTGTSLVDYLKSIDVDSSFSNRQALAVDNGISGYSGTASENSALLEILRSGASVLPTATVSVMADEVVKGLHGTGHTNREASLKAKYSNVDYDAVRMEVNSRF